MKLGITITFGDIQWWVTVLICNISTSLFVGINLTQNMKQFRIISYWTINAFGN
jgi:hypothetical protein